MAKPDDDDDDDIDEEFWKCLTKAMKRPDFKALMMEHLQIPPSHKGTPEPSETGSYLERQNAMLLSELLKLKGKLTLEPSPSEPAPEPAPGPNPEPPKPPVKKAPFWR
jgi:hypothetical protein